MALPLSETPVRPVEHAAQARIASLDAFRGFAMFWLVGGQAFLLSFCPLMPTHIAEIMRCQWGHAPWEGMRFYDLIWPSFMLMVGASIPLSWAKRSQSDSGRQYLFHALKRAIVLFLLGSLRASLGSHTPTLIELSSALQPIAVAYLVASLLVMTSPKVQALVAAGILGGYGLLLALVSTPGVPAGSYQIDANLVRTVDLAVLGCVHPGGWGTVLSTIPTLATTILGLLIGRLLMSQLSMARKTVVLTAVGLGLLVAGLALSPVVPVIMKLWTVSYGLLSAGWACLMFAAFYFAVDLCGCRRAAFPLVVIGTNALAAYLGPMLVPTARVVAIYTKPIALHLGSPWGQVLTTGCVLLLNWLILWWMFRRKIFLRP